MDPVMESEGFSKELTRDEGSALSPKSADPGSTGQDQPRRPSRASLCPPSPPPNLDPAGVQGSKWREEAPFHFQHLPRPYTCPPRPT